MKVATELNWSQSLKTPITTILLQTKKLQQEPLTPHQKKCVNNIVSAVTQLLSSTKQRNKSSLKKLRNVPLATSPTETSSTNILLVEDVPILQKVHSLMLQELGYHADVVGTAGEALARFNNHYDLILMDIGLPDQSGIEVTKKIRAENKNIPIIMLTSQDGDLIKTASIQAGANEFLTKPVLKEKLGDIIQYWLRAN